ncbi:hypothetical protein PGT21_001176 [Puccinia graminis f. sp. tritici]|uniref:Uncharacterized protein n=1 Tax=Puccinia graminis f. sp. tritici TaxID=56615 RepID=A0A5B0SDQ9_PUCGR|nr:hypothetical protein PGT21_001176 [Puccinia graminis f. sp. tritici]KAA1134554.1 hypothetical protein PGTUg99_004262 [Puccinia graminis f. sp. tritici]
MQPSHDHTSNLTHTTQATDHHHDPGLTGEAGLNLQNNPNHPHDNVTAHPINKAEETETQVPFKAKVEGYAKKFAGKTFGKEHEVAAGEARLRGEDQPKH